MFVPERGSVLRSWAIDYEGSPVSEVRGMRLEVRKSRSLRSSDLLPLTSGSSQPKDGSMIRDEGLRTALHSVQRVLVLKLTADLRPVYKGDVIRPHFVCLLLPCLCSQFLPFGCLHRVG